ncbi:MAG: TusE/DsrC/DsvC family sulfur relay protein [Xanthomonadales bacterium]|nr:TusE/DsrC/DsvC family sulfur relay protein [Xanthomonadales bacterium]
MSAADEVHWLELPGRRLEVDARGYLLDPADWDEALATELARRDGIELGAEHWQVIHLLRSYHERHGRSPAMRLLVKEAAQALGTGVANSRVLYRLFPQGPAKQAARYAGLPRPTSCI